MNAVNPNSIRQLICTALLAGADTKSITEKIKAVHPNSKAAEKSVKHIAWYRADLRKRGLLPKPGATVETKTPDTVAIPNSEIFGEPETETPKSKRNR